jgi:SAM-dependent methyltransferase
MLFQRSDARLKPRATGDPMTLGREHWTTLAETADPDDLREQILTGFKTGKPFTPYVPTIALPRPIGRVLDFGCGLGRSFPYLKGIAGHVTGFDLPPMIERCWTLAPVRADVLIDRWEDVRSLTFDLIFAALVLQHLEPPLCRAHLADFARMSPAVYLLTRAGSDFGGNVLDLVGETNLFDESDCVEVDHDPSTHQLRVLGRRTFDEARRATDGHFEILLRSRPFVR